MNGQMVARTASRTNSTGRKPGEASEEALEYYGDSAFHRCQRMRPAAKPAAREMTLSMPPGSKSAPFCFSALEFTSTTQTLFGAPGKSMTEKVNYIVAQTATYPTTVYVTGDAGNHTTYEFSTKDKMFMDISALCTYQRQ
jgi:hypothetical protein